MSTDPIPVWYQPAQKCLDDTLTLTNTGDVTATNLLVTDTLPSGASYVGGGTQVGGVVTWTLGSLLPGAGAVVSFVVRATQTIPNSDYRVAVDGRLAAVGQAPVVTVGANTKYYYHGARRVAMRRAMCY